MFPKITQWIGITILAIIGLGSCLPAATGQETGSPTRLPVISNTVGQANVLLTTFTPSAIDLQALPVPTETLLAVTASSSPTPSPSATLTSEPTLPQEFFITDISGHHQYFPLGCETAAAVDWAHYFGISINEYDFQYHLPISDNPNYGFVGDINGPWGQVPPYAYGVYAGPVADLLGIYGVPAKAYKQYTLEQLKAKIAGKIPVIAWVIGNVEGGVQATYVDTSGRVALVAAYEHVVIVTGYDPDHIRYMNNGKFYTTPTQAFLNSWGVLDNMVIVDK